MRVPISLADALHLAKALMPDSKSTVLSVDKGKLQRVADWVTSDKTEKAESDRKIKGIRFYLALNSLAGHPGTSFSAKYVFQDGFIQTPDKATVKVWLRERLLRAECDDQSLVVGFSLTYKGQQMLVVSEIKE